MVVALDIGLKRIGVAKLLNGMALPSSPIFRKNRAQAVEEVRKMLVENRATKLVVGFPSSEDMRIKIGFFVECLDFAGEIFFVDENFSSIESKNALRGVVKNKKDGKIDSISAQIILQRWLDGSSQNFKGL